MAMNNPPCASSQIIVVAACGIRLANRFAVPHAAAVGHIAALCIHTLCAAVAAVQPDAEIHRVGARGGDALRRVHQPRADAEAAILLQHAEIDQLA